MLGSGRSRWNRVDGEQQPPAGDSHQTTHAVQRAEEDSLSRPNRVKNHETASCREDELLTVQQIEKLALGVLS